MRVRTRVKKKKKKNNFFLSYVYETLFFFVFSRENAFLFFFFFKNSTTFEVEFWRARDADFWNFYFFLKDFLKKRCTHFEMIFATIEGWARSPQSEGDSGRVRVGGHFWGLWRVFFLQAVKLSPSNRKCRKSKIFSENLAVWRKSSIFAA